MKANVYTLVYAAVLGTACAMVLTFAASFTKPYKDANKKAEENKNILLALNVSIPDNASSEQLVEIYNKNVQVQERGDLTTYVYTPPGNNNGAIAIRFVGPGLWGPIKGFLALDPKMVKIRGITFYEQEETPGLGAEISSYDKFQQQWEGKLLSNDDGSFHPFLVSKTPADPNDKHAVDGITGGTITSKAVEEMVNRAVSVYAAYFESIKNESVQ